MLGPRPHSILGISKDASEAEIRSAYHKAAKKYHPDKQTSQQEKDKANQMFSQVNEAYESLISQFHSSYGDEGEQDLAGEPPSRPRPKTGTKKVCKSSNTSTSRTSLSGSESGEHKPSSFSSQRPESPKTPRRTFSTSNSPAAGGRRSIRTSRSNITSPGVSPKSPGSMSGKKSIRDSISSKSPHATSGRPRPRPVQRNSSVPSRHSSGPNLSASTSAAAAGHQRSRSSLVGGGPPRPPLDSPTPTRKKQSLMNSPVSPNRKGESMRAGNDRPSMADPSLSPLKTQKSPVHKRHNSFGSLNYHHHAPPPPAPMMPASPTLSRTLSAGNLKKLKKPTAPPPPQSALQRISMKLIHRNELKAEKKARAEKLMQ